MAAESGSTRAVTEREADDLVRDADRFLAVIEQTLGLTPHIPLGDQLAGRAAG
ncbi:SAV_6107 family HEPN domain-containing protein [Nocardioides pelophilus]|uniref:SAV_6107 family HEPN domain-containing protein n=1 Tax=Nocardioides pelophilus TaxID=2172019 RepID=UPI001FEC9B18|nr:SAV_6107 family HEPN domain-containing protein [Nocardioides pelophilus]